MQLFTPAGLARHARTTLAACLLLTAHAATARDIELSVRTGRDTISEIWYVYWPNPAYFVFERGGDTVTSFTARFTLSGTAEYGVDYHVRGTTVTFAPHQTAAWLPVFLNIDDDIEGWESAVCTLQPDPAYRLVSREAVVRIEDDWRRNPYNGHFYRKTDRGSFDDARMAAEAIGGHLVALESDDENRWLEQWLAVEAYEDRYYWLGLTREGPAEDWRWINEAPCNFVNWAGGMPSSDPQHRYTIVDIGDYGGGGGGSWLSAPAGTQAEQEQYRGIVEWDDIQLLDPAPGAVWTVGEQARIHWKLNRYEAGTAARFELWDGRGRVADLGAAYDFSGEGVHRFQVPNVPIGDDYQLRVISMWYEYQGVEPAAVPSELLTITRPNATDRAWLRYE